MSETHPPEHTPVPAQIVVGRTDGNGLILLVDGQRLDLAVCGDPGPMIHPATSQRPYEMLTITLVAERVELVTVVEPEPAEPVPVPVPVVVPVVEDVPIPGAIPAWDRDALEAAAAAEAEDDRLAIERELADAEVDATP